MTQCPSWITLQGAWIGAFPLTGFLSEFLGLLLTGFIPQNLGPEIKVVTDPGMVICCSFGPKFKTQTPLLGIELDWLVFQVKVIHLRSWNDKSCKRSLRFKFRQTLKIQTNWHILWQVFASGVGNVLPTKTMLVGKINSTLPPVCPGDTIVDPGS